MGFLDFGGITDFITKPFDFVTDSLTNVTNFIGDGLTGIVNFGGQFLTSALNSFNSLVNNPLLIIALIGGGFLLITFFKD